MVIAQSLNLHALWSVVIRLLGKERIAPLKLHCQLVLQHRVLIIDWDGHGMAFL